MQLPFEVGRTHLVFGEVSQRCGERAAAGRHLAQATLWLSPLAVPRYHQRIRALATALVP